VRKAKLFEQIEENEIIRACSNYFSFRKMRKNEVFHFFWYFWLSGMDGILIPPSILF